LAKNENQKYGAVNTINLAEVTQKYLDLFDGIIKEKQLSVETSFKESFDLEIHSFLADSLISNFIARCHKV
jgi:two-component system, OmpR family, sensor kinase